MKRQFSTALLLVFLGVSGQDKYAAGMSRAMELWSAGKLTEATGQFERIAQAEPDRWQPPYYVALLSTFIAFETQDEASLSQLLARASENLAMAEKRSPGNAEILVVKAMINTAWISFDGSRFGMTLSPVNTALYREALALAPDNPRVVFSKAEWDMGSARYFGKDVRPYCGEVERALKLFEKFRPEGDFDPNWGEARARRVAEACGK